MGQCAVAQQNSFRQELRDTIYNEEGQFKNSKINTDKKNQFSKITYIQHNDQLIYQFQQVARPSQTLFVKKWAQKVYSQNMFTAKKNNLLEVVVQKNNSSMSTKIGLNLVQAVSQNLFITDSNMILQIFSIKDSNLNGKQFNHIAGLYYQLNKLKQNISNLKPIVKDRQMFVLPQQLFIKKACQSDQQIILIFQSQFFQRQIVSLKQLGRHMHLNGIQWQDSQFQSIIEECLFQIQLLHQQHFYLFSQFFIDLHGNCYCLGGFDSCKSNNILLRNRDINHLYEYLIQSLYGDKKYLNQSLRNQVEQKCKFNHPESTTKLTKILQNANKTIDISSALTKKIKTNTNTNNSNHIQTYVNSFKAKRKQNCSEQIAVAYSQIGQLFKSKQIYIELYSLSLYNTTSSNSIVHTSRQNKLKMNNQFSKNQTAKNQSCLDLFIKIINLQKKLMKISEHTQIEQLCNQFIKCVLFLSKRQTQRGNYLKSLSILQKISQTIGDEQFLSNVLQNWAISLQKADNYLFLQDIQKSQKYYNEAFRNQLNETTLCKIAKFYISVLNWQHAIAILRQYESVIQEHYLYQFLIAKCILAKSLCISPYLKQNQQERNYLLRQSLRIFKRVLQRKFKNNVFLIETYEAIGDCFFYMMCFSDALSHYQKSLALIQYQEYQKQKSSQLHQGFNVVEQSISAIQSNSASKSKNKSILNTSISFLNASPSFQNYETSSPDKKSILQASIANIYLMEKKYSECLQMYEKARKNLLHGNQTLKNSIIGNMGICLMQMGRKQEGKQTIKHIFADLDKKKVLNNINYVFLKEQCQR